MAKLIQAFRGKVPQNLFIGFIVFYEFTVYMANDLIMPAMTQVVKEFKANEELIPLSLSLYLLGGISLQWVIGPISDRFGRRPILIFGSLFFSLFTLLISLSFSMQSFLILRGFQGMGLCFIAVCGYASVQELFEEKKAVRVIAWMSSVAVLAPILGPIIGGFLVDVFSWRWVFIVLLFCSLISTIGLWKTMPESVAPAQVKLLIREERKLGFLRSILHEMGQVIATYFRILKNKRVILGSIINGLLAAPLLCWIAVSPIILFEKAHISPSYYGLVQVPIFGLYLAGNMLLRYLTHHCSLNQILKIGAPICLGSLVLFCGTMVVYPRAYWSIIIPLSLFSFGVGIVSGPLARKTLYATNETKGTVTAVFQFITHVVLVAGVSLMPLLLRGM